MNLIELKHLLGPLAPRFDVDCLERCPSTSTLLMERAEAGAPSGSVLTCEDQTAGRGRRGRTWLAPTGGALAFSLLWRFPPGSPPPMGLSLAVGVAVARALSGLGVSSLRLKWPNDVLIQGRKLAGILVELAPARNRSIAVVIGIGVNLALPPDFPDGPEIRAADLASALAGAPSGEVVLAGLLAELLAVLDTFGREGFVGLRDEWMAHHAHQDRPVRILDENAPPLEGLCRGVDGDGALLLETAQGLTRVLAGEVSLREAP